MILDQNQIQSASLDRLLFIELKELVYNNRNQVEKQWQGISKKSNLQGVQFKNFISNQYQMIFKQNEILQQIKQEIISKRTHYNNQILFYGSNTNAIDILPIQSSFDMSNISSVDGYQDEPFKTKFGEQFQKGRLFSALNQVHQNCTAQTYDLIKSSISNNKQNQYEVLNEKIQKIIRRNQQIQTSFIIKSTQLSNAQNQLKQATVKLQIFEEQKKKLKLKNNLLSQKEKRILKMETSIVFKQKLFHQGKKRYQREKALFCAIQDRLNQLYTKMHILWQNILKKMELSDKIGCIIPCENDPEALSSCWKKQVMRKCKQQLIDQRNLLKQQEQAIQKQHEMIQLLSDQVRKLANQKQISFQNPNSFSPSPSSIIVET